MDNQDWERQREVIKEERIWQKALKNATEGLTTEELERLTPDLCRRAPKLFEALRKIAPWLVISRNGGNKMLAKDEAIYAVRQALSLAEPKEEK